jgi:malate dehydrogenase (oxaloacetate-decarboxylating)
MMVVLDALIYHGLGFGAVLAKARSLSDGMILAGAQRLAPALKDPDDALLPDFADAPGVNFEIAVAVAGQAIAEGVANVDWNDLQVRERAKKISNSYRSIVSMRTTRTVRSKSIF